jgi:hypothetical protein
MFVYAVRYDFVGNGVVLSMRASIDATMLCRWDLCCRRLLTNWDMFIERDTCIIGRECAEHVGLQGCATKGIVTEDVCFASRWSKGMLVLPNEQQRQK